MDFEKTTTGEDGPHRWATRFSTFASALARASSTADALGLIIDAARTLVPAADLVGVTIARDDGVFETAASNDPLIVKLDDLQYRLQEGPCILAGRRAALGLYASADLSADPRVGRWGPEAVRHGVRSALAAGLFAHEDPPRVGALNLMSRRPGGFAGGDHDIAIVLAAHAATVLGSRASAAKAAETNDNLRAALRNRDVIGQAKGILMEREHISEEKAFAILRSVSQRLNVKLADIAHTIADRRSDL